MKYASFLGVFVLCGAVLWACETSDATLAVFDNDYPANAGGGAPSATIYKGWWSVAQLSEPVLPGAESDPVRVVKGSDYAYLLLAPGWDPACRNSPTTLLPLRTKAPLSVARGDTLHIAISDATAMGNCATGEALSQDDADFITQRIFPAEFAGQTYDAATCVASVVAEGGAAGQAAVP